MILYSLTLAFIAFICQDQLVQVQGNFCFNLLVAWCDHVGKQDQKSIDAIVALGTYTFQG